MNLFKIKYYANIFNIISVVLALYLVIIKIILRELSNYPIYLILGAFNFWVMWNYNDVFWGLVEKWRSKK